MRSKFISFAVFALSAMAAGFISGPTATAQSSEPSHQRWSGAYVGANLGYHDINTSGIFDGAEPGGTPDLRNIGGEGPNLGVQAGYNWQMNHIVFGVEADASWGGFSKSYTTIQDGGPTEAGLFSYPIVGDLAYLATARARAGIHSTLVGRDMLLFVTGGAAFTQFNMNIADGRGRVAFDAVGSVVGGGVEIALTDRWSLAAEFLHHDFGKQLNISDATTSGVFDANDGNYVKLNTVDIGRVGLSFKLN